MNIAIKISKYREDPDKPDYSISKDFLELLQKEFGILKAVKIVDKETYDQVNNSQAAQQNA